VSKILPTLSFISLNVPLIVSFIDDKSGRGILMLSISFEKYSNLFFIPSIIYLISQLDFDCISINAVMAVNS